MRKGDENKNVAVDEQKKRERRKGERKEKRERNGQ